MSAALNRLTLMVVALAVLATAGVAGAVELRLLDAGTVRDAVDYRVAIDQLDTWTSSDGLTGGQRTLVFVVGLALALLATWWLVRELSFGYRAPGPQTIDEQDPRTEGTTVSAAATRHVVEGAALEAGARSAKVALRPADGGGAHDVRCSVIGAQGEDLLELGRAVRTSIARVLDANALTHASITVDVDGLTQRKRALR